MRILAEIIGGLFLAVAVFLGVWYGLSNVSFRKPPPIPNSEPDPMIEPDVPNPKTPKETN